MLFFNFMRIKYEWAYQVYRASYVAFSYIYFVVPQAQSLVIWGFAFFLGFCFFLGLQALRGGIYDYEWVGEL